MHLRELVYTGYFEEQEASTSETLQIVAPDDDLETDLLAWVLLPKPRVFEDDPARAGYIFHYELGEQVNEGIFAMTVRARDASGREHAVEIGAALVSVVPTTSARTHGFVAFWLLSDAIHFKPLEKVTYDQYHGPAYGRLSFGRSAALPHRRLFGAAV